MNQVPCSGVTVIDRSAGAGILAVVRSITRFHHCRERLSPRQRF